MIYFRLKSSSRIRLFTQAGEEEGERFLPRTVHERGNKQIHKQQNTGLRNTNDKLPPVQPLSLFTFPRASNRYFLTLTYYNMLLRIPLLPYQTAVPASQRLVFSPQRHHYSPSSRKTFPFPTYTTGYVFRNTTPLSCPIREFPSTTPQYFKANSCVEIPRLSERVVSIVTKRL